MMCEIMPSSSAPLGADVANQIFNGGHYATAASSRAASGYIEISNPQSIHRGSEIDEAFCGGAI